MPITPFTRKTASQIIPIAITVFLLITVVYATQFYTQPEQLGQFISQIGPLSIVAYVVAVLLANIAAPISASPLLLLGYSIYGQNAIWLFALGNTLAMATNFYLARKFGFALMAKLVGQANMDKINELSHNYGLIALFMVRVFLSGISDIASYAFGLSPIKFRPYIIVSIIGSLPPYLLLYFFSSQGQSSLQFLLMQLSIAGVLSIIFLVSRYLKNRFLQLLLKGS